MSPLACRVFGHRIAFRAEGPTMKWGCERGCAGAGGSKTYPSALEAARFATAFDRRDGERLGKRAPLVGLLPLRIWRWLQDRGERTGERTG